VRVPRVIAYVPTFSPGARGLGPQRRFEAKCERAKGPESGEPSRTASLTFRPSARVESEVVGIGGLAATEEASLLGAETKVPLCGGGAASSSQLGPH
jgi:hypothetical protein